MNRKLKNRQKKKLVVPNSIMAELNPRPQALAIHTRIHTFNQKFQNSSVSWTPKKKVIQKSARISSVTNMQFFFVFDFILFRKRHNCNSIDVGRANSDTICSEKNKKRNEFNEIFGIMYYAYTNSKNNSYLPVVTIYWNGNPMNLFKF